MRDNIVKTKSFDFAVWIVRLYQYLCCDKRVCAIKAVKIRQVLGLWFVRQNTESKQDFIHKFAIAQKKLMR
jgi:hypothetical protein